MEKKIQLLVIEESRSDADALANILRNSGLSLQLDYVADQNDLEKSLGKQLPDLILYALEQESLSISAINETLTQHELTIPLIGISEIADEPAIINAMQQGASDLCSYDQPEHLQLVAHREISRQGGSVASTSNFEQKFLESENRARLLIDSSRDSIAYVHEGMHIYANYSYLKMFGFSALEDIEGIPLLDMVAPEGHVELKNKLRTHNKNADQTTQLNTLGLFPDGEMFNAEMELTPASMDGEACTQIVIRTQSEADPELEEKLKHLTTKDNLTGLYNRQHFMEELDRVVANAENESSSTGVIYLSMDNFKEIKNAIGISAADSVITDIASLLQENTTADDICARFGDHTFTVLRKNVGGSEIEVLGEKLRAVVENHIADVDNRSITTTCSLGITATTPSKSSSAHEIIARADLACEVARTSGGNQTHMQHPVVVEATGKELDQQIQTSIDEALDEDRFQLMFQPIVSLHGVDGEKYEVLLRMTNNEGTQILPGQFIPIAEKAGQLQFIDRWVIKHSIQTLAEHRANGSDTYFFIKISGTTLTDPELPTFVAECIYTSGVQPDTIIFEIAENDAAEQLKHAMSFTKAMKKLCCKTALEHFGNNANSFQLLKHLPVDFLKIDGSFMENLASDGDKQAAIKNILEAAHSTNTQCIAEFVQDPHSLGVLWQSGVDYIQGNFLQEASTTLSYDFSGEIA